MTIAANWPRNLEFARLKRASRRRTPRLVEIKLARFAVADVVSEQQRKCASGLDGGLNGIDGHSMLA